MEKIVSTVDKHNQRGGLRQTGMEKFSLPRQPLVTIVTIVLNGAEHLRKTIDSVLQQSYGLIEYIVIDGGSTDATVDILRSYESRLDYWQSESDQGISDAFNKGIQLARGEYIGLVNAGDWYEPDTVEYIVKCFVNQPETGVVCGALQFWTNQDPAFLCYSEPRLLDRDMTVTHPSCFVRADLYKEFGGFSLEFKFAMDYEFLLRLQTNGVIFYGSKKLLANMQHAGVSESNWQHALEETHRARRHLLPGSFFASGLYFRFVFAKRSIRIWLEKKNCLSLLRFYRQRLALVKKTQ